jgi:hypothetical protein
MRAVNILLSLAACAGLSPLVRGQQPPPPPRPQTGQAAAPVDLTGTWVSIVTEDWRYRMVTPARGDMASIPVTPKAVSAALAWNPDADEKAGEACKSYGAPGIMHIPGRIRISWQDANTLRVETDAGTQTRLLHFVPDTAAKSAAQSWQGYSTAEWETQAGGRGGRVPTGSLKVVTMRLRPGYLRKNGVPYSANAVLTEYWDLNAGPDGAQWIVITSVVEDSEFLDKPWVTSPNFRKEANDAGWKPTACSPTW